MLSDASGNNVGGEARTTRIERLRELFDRDVVKLTLSLLILLSVFPRLERYWLLFFSVFSIEIAFRVLIVRDDIKRRSLGRLDMIVLLVDVVALISFLPLDVLFEIRFLRVFRLSRMLMLLSYWAPVVREVWIILMRRERRYQLLFAASVVAIFAFTTAILLYHFGETAIDFNEDGASGLGDRDFWAIVWWSFRQLQDPGNLLRQAQPSLAFVFSLMLTLVGIFVMAFLIGIGTTIVEELVAVSRQRRLGLRHHSVLCNVGPYSRVLVEELLAYYAKSFRAPRLVTMGPAAARHDFLQAERMRRIRYRAGIASSEQDLITVDADRARRVILLANPERRSADAEVVSQLLSVRAVNPGCLVFAELADRRNAEIAAQAGGHVVPILAQHLVAMLIVQILHDPATAPLLWQLLSAEGHELYSCIYGWEAAERLTAPRLDRAELDSLLYHCHRRYGVIVVGSLGKMGEDVPPALIHELRPSEAGGGVPASSRLTLDGMFGVASNFEQLRKSAVAIAQGMPSTLELPPAAPATPPLQVARCSRPPEGVLICGYYEGLIDLCEQLALTCAGSALFLMVPEGTHVDDLVAQLVARSARTGPAAPGAGSRGDAGWSSRVRYRSEGAGRIAYAVEADDGEAGANGEIVIFAGDWSDDQQLRASADGRYRLDHVDAVIFGHTMTDADPDARSALGLLKLLATDGRVAGDVRPPDRPLRVVCVVRDDDKATLFARRFGTTARVDGRSTTISVVAAERLRNALLAQGVFVPQLGQIYHKLFGRPSSPLWELRPPEAERPSGQRTSFSRLLLEVYRQHGLIAVAIEIESDDGGLQLVVNPQPQAGDDELAWATIRQIYALGLDEYAVDGG